MDQSANEPSPLPGLPPEVEAEILSHLRAGHTIEAIKLLRARTGWGLADAKHWVDQRLEPVARSTAPCPYCHAPLRTAQAQQCLTCGMDWHDPAQPRRLP